MSRGSTVKGQHAPTGAQTEEDPQAASSKPGPGSSFSSSVTSRSVGSPPSMSRGPERSLVTSGSIDVQIGRARGGAGLLRRSMRPPRRLTRCLSSATAMVSYPAPSTYAFQGHGHPGVEIASNPSRPPADEPVCSSSASSSNPPRKGDNVLMVSIDRQLVTLSIPALSTFESPLCDKPETPAPSSRDKRVSESAFDILRRFGLEKEDLDHLVSYPADQITPASLPFILRQIGIEKAQRALASVQREARPEPRPAGSQSAADADGAARLQEEMSPAAIEPGEVTDRERSDECMEGAAEVVSAGSSRETSGGNGSTSPTDAAGNKTEVESGALGSSRDQAGPAFGLGTPHAPKLSCAARMPIQPDLQALLGSPPLPSTDSDSTPLIGRESALGRRSTLENQAPCTLGLSGAAPEPEPVLDGSSNAGVRSTAQRPVPRTASPSFSSGVESAVPACRPSVVPPPGPSDVPHPTPPSADQQAPGSFPHTCCPCRVKCLQMKDWISHQNTDRHLERLKRTAGEDAEPSARSQTSRRGQKAAHGGRSGSSASGGRENPCSRSRSPRSRSPERRRDERRSTSRRRDERRSTSRRRDERRSTSRRRDERRSTSRRRDERRSTSRRRDERRSTSRRRDERRSTSRRRDERRSTSRRRDERRSTSRRRDERRSTSRRRDESLGSQRSNEESTSASCKKLAEKLLENSAVDLLSKPSHVHALLRSLAPIVLAELAKRKSPLPSSTPAASSSPPPAKKKTPLPSSSSSSSTPAASSSPPSAKKKTPLPSSSSSSSTPAASSSPPPAKKKSPFPSSSSSTPAASSSPPSAKKKTPLPSSSSSSSSSTPAASSSPPSANKKSPFPSSSSSTPAASSSPPSAKKKSPFPSSSSSTPAASSSPPSAKKKTPLPSSSSSSSTPAASSSPPSAKKKTPLPSSFSSSSTPASSSSPPSAKKKSTQKASEASSSPRTECGKPSPPTMVKLTGIHASLSRSDVLAAVQRFGKAKSFLLFPSKLEAIVCFETKEDASKLKSLKSLDVKGIQISVVEGMNAVCHKQKKPPITRASASSIFPPESTVERKLLLPEKPPPATPAARGGPFKGRGNATEERRVSAACVTEMVCQTQSPEAAEAVATATPLTVGEVIEKHLSRERIKLFKRENVSSDSPIEGLEKEEDAKESNGLKSLDLKGITVTVVGGKKTVTEEQKKPLTRTASSSVCRHHNTRQPEVSRTPPASSAEGAEPGAAGAEGAPGDAATVGESVEKYLRRNRLKLLEEESVFGEQDPPHPCKLLLITNLPRYHDGCYTEEELAALLRPFGFCYTEDSIYVVPQTCMAFFEVPAVGIAQEILKVSARDGVFFKSSRLAFSAVAGGIAMTPLGFYKSLMELMCFDVQDDGQRIVFIRNISMKESSKLREALNKIQSIKNFLPLLNQAFVEFKTVRDADRLGVWYGLRRRAPDHRVHRLKAPLAGFDSRRPPKLPANALPDGADVVAGATVPPTASGVPRGSVGPFWVTMRTRPFLFPTRSPWFIIPDFLTSRTPNNLLKAMRGPKIPTVMLTGLPEENYRHEDVAKLVRRFFPGWNLYSAFYDVVVLPLQRRAFVFFADWSSCCGFVRDHVRNPVAVNRRPLTAHFVLEDISPFSTEEAMYATLMKWSNAGVPEPAGLEERLLCVETAETSPHITRVVLEAVASVASVLGFLPLANRICIEMSDAGGVTAVVEKHRHCLFFWMKNVAFWNKVLRVESLKSLKRRLEDPDEVINIESKNVLIE